MSEDLTGDGTILIPVITVESNPGSGVEVRPQPAPYKGPRGLGLGIGWQLSIEKPIYQKIVDELRPVWWLDWQYNHFDIPNYYPMWFMPRADEHFLAASAAALQHPGHFWLNGNEPDRSETWVEPEVAAVALNDWKGYARTDFAAPGIQLNDNGYAWLWRYLDAEGPIPDAWNVHLYCSSAQHGRDMLVKFSDRMEERKVGRPIVITETSVYGGTPEMQIEWWETLAEWAECGAFGLMAAAVFGAYWEPWPWSNLTDAEGRAYQYAQDFSRLSAASV